MCVCTRVTPLAHFKYTCVHCTCSTNIRLNHVCVPGSHLSLGIFCRLWDAAARFYRAGFKHLKQTMVRVVLAAAPSSSIPSLKQRSSLSLKTQLVSQLAHDSPEATGHILYTIHKEAKPLCSLRRGFSSSCTYNEPEEKLQGIASRLKYISNRLLWNHLLKWGPRGHPFDSV